eukprot:6223275-Heterocapsa_arctica.AAC.1
MIQPLQDTPCCSKHCHRHAAHTCSAVQSSSVFLEYSLRVSRLRLLFLDSLIVSKVTPVLFNLPRITSKPKVNLLQDA